MYWIRPPVACLGLHRPTQVHHHQIPQVSCKAHIFNLPPHGVESQEQLLDKLGVGAVGGVLVVVAAATPRVSWEGDQEDFGHVPHGTDDGGADVNAVLEKLLGGQHDLPVHMVLVGAGLLPAGHQSSVLGAGHVDCVVE